MGFEPTRAEPIGLAVQRLNHSATSSSIRHSIFLRNYKIVNIHNIPNSEFTKYKTPKINILNSSNIKRFPRRELNPGLLGESQLS